MSLTARLKKYADASAIKIPQPAQEIMKQAISELENDPLLSKATRKGDVFPDFELPNATGTKVTLKSLLDKGKVIITFYRGGWCPYCNIELKAFQEVLPEIKAKGATLVAITPETPDNTLTTIEKNELDFEVLTSRGNDLARKLNLVYKLPKNLVDLYKSFGIDLLESQGNSANELPIAATYIIDQNGIVDYHFLAEDYKLRADPLEVLENL